MNDVVFRRDLLIGRKIGDFTIIGWRKERAYFYLLLDNGLEVAFQSHHKNESIMEYLNGNQVKSPHTAFIVGNGPSIQNTDLDLLIGKRSYGTNRVWRLWEEFKPETKWRPTDYVRLEKGNAKEDILKMSEIGCAMHVQRGVSSMNTKGREDYFATCDSKHNHDWHLPIICGYGTVVHAAMQIAVREGAERIILLGCDLGMPLHFYGSEGIDNDSLAQEAHEIAKASCPVPVYNATIGGQLDTYERIGLEETIRRFCS